MNDTTTPTHGADNALAQLTDRATAQADGALAATRRAANGALDKLQDGVDQLREDTPGALSRIAAQVDELTRRSIERARQASMEVRHSVDRTSERTVGYIQEQPMKSVLIAAAGGAAVAVLIGLLARGLGSSSDRR